MHGSTIPEKEQRVREIVEFLIPLGYTDIRHIESGDAIRPDNAALAREGHLYCRTRS